MSIFKNKSIWKKIVIAFLIIVFFQSVNSKPVHADVVEFGGKLMSPILSLVTSIGDGIMDIIVRTIMGAHASLYEVELGSKFWETLATIIVAVAAAAVAIVLVVLTAGLAAVALAAVGITAGVTVGIGTLLVVGGGAGLMAAVWFNDQVLPDDLYLPMYTYSAEEIFKGNILLFDVNFFDSNPPQIQEHRNGNGAVEYYYYINDKGEEVKTSNQSSSVMLKKTISTWYNAIRNICIVLMLSILVYIGIRMMLTSLANDKAKYLNMLKDWFIGLCLLFLMHYIMAFSVTLVEKITDVVKTSVSKDSYNVVIEASNSKIKQAVDADHLNMPDLIQKGADGKDYLSWPTNLMGSLRLQLQMEQYGASYVGLTVCYFILCILTVYFTYIYLRRVLYMAFLTLISPLVALTYCIDKINDGKAQGFNKWFREYIFNLLIQPMHLLLYYILITSAFEFASSNVIYSIVALGFMIPAEKILRSLFGFEKAHTPPILGPAGAVAAGQLLSNFLRSGKKGKIGPGRQSGNLDSAEGIKPPNVREPVDIYGTLGSGDEDDSPRIPIQGSNPDDSHGHTPETPPEDVPDIRQAPEPVLDEGNQNPDDDYDNPWPTMEQYNDPDFEVMNDDTHRTGEIPEMNVPEIEQPEMPQQELPREQTTPQQGLPRGQTAPQQSTPREQTPPQQNPPRREQTMPQQEQPRQQRIPEQTQTPPTPRRDTNHNDPNSRRGKVKRRIKRGMEANWAAQKAEFRQTPTKLKGAVKDVYANSHPLKTAGKIAAGAAVATVAGTAGVALGTVTGDFSNVVKMGVGSTVGGYKYGSNLADGMRSPMDDENIRRIHDETYNKGIGGAYKEDSMDEFVEKFVNDERLRAALERTFGDVEAKRMLKTSKDEDSGGGEGEVEIYIKHGVTDHKDIVALHKLQEPSRDNGIDTPEKALAAREVGNTIGSGPLTTKKEQEWTDTFERGARNRGIQNPREFAEKAIKSGKEFNELKK